MLTFSSKKYFFCGVGGSGMLPLAAILMEKGAIVSGSDRAFDQGQTPQKFHKIKEMGIKLFPQDGSGIEDDTHVLVVSSAVESHIPDVRVALERGISIKKRAEILSSLFNRAKRSIGIAGTSGKTTVTGMIAYILEKGGYAPCVVNGGEIVNFLKDQVVANYRVGGGEDVPFVAETDESDGSIALYHPSVAVLNNISQDHKSIEELKALFLDFVTRAKEGAVLNLDNSRVASLYSAVSLSSSSSILTYGIENEQADIVACDLVFAPEGVSCRVIERETGKDLCLTLSVPGLHNVSNALAALCAAKMMGMSIEESASLLAGFKGIRRRLEIVGTKDGVTIIDDFAHNPDKISASLDALKEFSGRLLVMFQPHGYAPLKMMRDKLVDVLSDYLDEDDIFVLTEPYYAGGTVEKSISSKDIVEDLKENGLNAHFFTNRDQIERFLKENAQNNDRIVIMGARDDTLTQFAGHFL